MNRILFSVLCVIVIVSSVEAQQTSWQWVNPLPQGNILNGVATINQDTIFAAGDYGTVIKSTNGGTTWHVLPTAGGMLEALYSIYFVSGTYGWAVGTTGQLIRTTDAGVRWSYHQVPTYSDLFAVSFVSPTHGWVAGSNGVIFGTTDGGLTWASESSKTTVNLYGLHFLNTTTGWVVGSGGKILKTTNGGATWSAQPSNTTQPLYSIHFTSATNGFAVGAFGTVLKTVNGGSVWSPQVSSTSYGLYTVHFSSSLVGWASGAYGTITKTTNGGITWTEQSSGTYNDIFNLQFVSATQGWAVGDLGVIVKTTDGGATWTSLSTGPKTTINAMHFPTPTSGFAVGEEGAIIRSSDGGLTWTAVPSGLFQTLYGVYFLNSNVGWAVGDSAVIFKTTNGGFSWNDQNSRSEESLYSIYFVSTTTGWAVGDFGTILKTTNGGTSWIPQTSNTFTTFLRIKFLNTTTGYAVGYGGSIFKTTDGGSFWEEQTSNTTQALYSIEIIDANTAYVVGDFGTVLKTTNGGLDWSQLTTGADASLYGVTFYSPSMGWAAGDDGTIIGTTNGGNTWNVQTSGTYQTLWEIQLARASSGGVIFAAGYGGTIVCSSVSPLPLRTWTGTFDTSWTNPGNWSPIGTPQKVDSVVIPLTANKPSLRGTIQQVNISSLRVASGQKLTIGTGVAEFSVKGNVNIDGTVEVEPLAKTQFITGGNFVVGTGGLFIPGNSTVNFTSRGSVRGSFNNIVVSESAHVQTLGNISANNYIFMLSDLTLRSVDTLTLYSRDPYALQGNGSTGGGTIKRAIQPGSTTPYRFESPATSIRFYNGGTLPDTVTVTTYPNTLPPGLPDSVYVRRFYNITATGGTNFMSTISLRYDTSETPISIDELALYRDSSDVIRNMGQSDFLDSDYVAIIVDSVQKFSKWYLGRLDYTPVHAFEFTDSLFLTDNGSIQDTLYFGASPFATDGIDAAFGEASLPPKPGAGTFDVRWTIPSSQGSIKDIKTVSTLTHPVNTYTCSLQPGPGGYPFALRWNNTILPAGTFILRDVATHGGQFSVNMKTQTQYNVTNPAIASVEIVHTGPNYYAMAAGWNIVSLPLTPTINGAKTRIFPTSTSNAFGFNDGYYFEDTLQNTFAYWLKFPTAQSVGIDGFARSLDTVNVTTGWNMIGTITYPVSVTNVTQVPGGNVASTYFQFSNGYIVTDSLRPAKGYWVKVNNDGKLILSSTGAAAMTKESPLKKFEEETSSLNSVLITDREGNKQTLYFSSKNNAVETANFYELPPLPPQEVFDARFTTQRMVEQSADGISLPSIKVQSFAYPITVQWEIRESNIKGLSIRDAATGKNLASTFGGSNGSLRISQPSVNTLAVALTGSEEHPKIFALRQNFPNPFNPSTTIRFELPAASLVSLKIYNILGQEVATLADQESFDAGTHSVQFDASRLGSGVYFYRVLARGNGKEYSQVRKMVLLK
jgi:photosystem II stability/assembly factor-like uncharacterized protein